MRHFSLRAIAPIAISSITAAWISKWTFGDNPLFMVSDPAPNLIELLPAALVAGPILVFGGHIYAEFASKRGFCSWVKLVHGRLVLQRSQLLAALECLFQRCWVWVGETISFVLSARMKHFI